MRILVTVAHYFKQNQEASWHTGLGGSSYLPLPKIAALNAQIVGLQRYFGARRMSLNLEDPQSTVPSPYELDIVVMTQRDANLLELIGIDPKTYSVEYCDGPPRMLPFEAQRIMRDRVGQYDMYAYMEDDLVVDDPAFLEKIAWFAGEFGPRALLMPVRYEMASTGTPAKLSLSNQLSSETRAPFRRPELAAVLRGRWNDKEQSFRIPSNPHVGCYAVTDGQLRLWIADPTFYDRDGSWVSPLESAATYSPGKVFGLYMPAEPDPWFLQIEHYGAQLAARSGQGGDAFGKPLLLTLLEVGDSDSRAAAEIPALLGKLAGSVPLQPAEAAARLQSELDLLKKSRSRLLKALLSAIWRKVSG
jgi:hypothetical protein